MISISCPLLQLPKIPTRMRDIRVRIVSSRIGEPAGSVGRHVAGAHYVLPYLVNAVATVECDCLCMLWFYGVDFWIVKHSEVVLENRVSFKHF
jgi:hypothetical protein